VNHASQLLAESPDLGTDERHLLAIIARNGGRIDGIVESVLQLSRGQQPELHSLDLKVWLRQLHAELSESRRLPAEHFHLSLAADTPPARANEGHLHQIIANLCDNAIKYASQGNQPPTLSLSAGLSGGTSPPGAFIDVCDDGAPIDPEVAREMFAPFYSTSASATGLGLYIALELAAMNGIGLEYRVTEAGGNGFRLTLPVLA
jgi:two-component system sensor histidine kinase PilS (NtrC family)